MPIRKFIALTVTAIFFYGCVGDPGVARRKRSVKALPSTVYLATDPRNAELPPDGQADAIPSPVTGVVKISKPYTVLDITYYPLATSRGYKEVGVASWYGPTFNTKKTGNGETYNQRDQTAAHRTLPFNTMVKVENLENGKSTTVRINDRGPFAKGRIIDLSEKAAEDIDMTRKGTAKVRLTAITHKSGGATVGGWPTPTGGGIPTPPAGGIDPAPASAGMPLADGFYVQAGAFSAPSGAEKLIGQMPSKFTGIARIRANETSRGTFHRVMVGPFADRGKAAKAGREITTFTRTGTMVIKKP